MKATKAQLERALKAPGATRLFLLYGPDESGSRAIVRQLAASAGADAERVTLAGSELKSDPARLGDEAAAISMFGSGRFVVVEPAGDELIEAVDALLVAGIVGNPVALVAGALKPTSKLLKLCLAAPGALAFESKLPDERDWSQLVIELARPLGLTMQPDVARRIAEGAAGNRAIVEQELAKYALFVGAEAGRTTAVDMAAVEAIGAAREEGDSFGLVDDVFAGNVADVVTELARLRSEGTEGITLIRAALRRALGIGKPRPLPGWSAERLERCVSRLLQAEHDVKNAGLGPIAADVELVAIARQARRR